MIFTNKFNLPQTIYNAIVKDDYVKEGDYSVTDLVSPPRITVLKQRHKDEIVKDVSDMLWALMGRAMHKILQSGDHEDVILESRISMQIGGVTISGMQDIYDIKQKAVEDYKFTSVWSFVCRNKPEWEAQVNLYGMLFRHIGFPVEKLSIHALLRDWKKSMAYDKGMPNIAFQTVSLLLWELGEAVDYAIGRLELLKMAQIELPECTPEERWAKPDTYAVMKKGNKKATKVCKTHEEAETYIDNIKDSKGMYIETRQGSQTVRCDDYCDVRDFCDWYIKNKMEGV